ncbi:DUF6247 family protein [Streptomyces syringium]|uniref:DUF6247 family protein n=1 Tax=Streptomyces syringium TaxID=76729 RepID=UPI003AAD834A
MPPVSEAALRAAVMRLDPASGVEFDREFHAAWEQALQQDSTVPMHTFLRRWAVFVSLHRFPGRSARVRELERLVGAASSLEEARAAANEVGRLLAAAESEIAGR